jgi:hypothetical protein
MAQRPRHIGEDRPVAVLDRPQTMSADLGTVVPGSGWPPTHIPPEHVSRVEGCDCSGGNMLHVLECSIWRLPREQALANVAAADQRLRDYSQMLTQHYFGPRP